MRISRIRITALAAVVLSATLATAQSTTPAFGLKLGAFFPTATDTRDQLGKTGYEAGVEYFLKNTLTEQSAIDLDFFHLGGTNNFQGVSLGYTGRYFQGSKGGSPSGAFFGFSGGVSFNRLNATTSGGGGSGGGSSVSENRTQLYGEAIAGYRVDKNLGVEAFYRVNTSIGGFNTNSFGLRLTYKL